MINCFYFHENQLAFLIILFICKVRHLIFSIVQPNFLNFEIHFFDENFHVEVFLNLFDAVSLKLDFIEYKISLTFIVLVYNKPLIVTIRGDDELEIFIIFNVLVEIKKNIHLF